jgi:hypothetical protein
VQFTEQMLLYLEDLFNADPEALFKRWHKKHMVKADFDYQKISMRYFCIVNRIDIRKLKRLMAIDPRLKMRIGLRARLIQSIRESSKNYESNPLKFREFLDDYRKGNPKFPHSSQFIRKK